MSFAPTGAWLLRRTLANRVRQQLGRLRRPRYLVPAAVGVLYLWGAVLRPGGGAFQETHPAAPELLRHPDVLAALAVSALALAAWVFGKARPRVPFTEAELQLLFPAPVPGRSLVHFLLAKVLLQSAIPAAFFGLVSMRAAGRSALAVALASWISIATLQLHAMGASLVRTRLHERLAGARLRAVQLGAAAALAAVAALAWNASHGSFLEGPLSWLLWPARALTRPSRAAGAAAFAAALPAAVAVLALHYAWVLRLAERFEEASLELAERLGRRREAFRRGGAGAVVASGRARPAPVRLPAWGGPVLALAWKGVIATSRSLRLRILAVTLPLTFAASLAVIALSGGDGELRLAGGVLSATGLVLVLVFGPVGAGSGLRSELGRIEFLRTLPLPSPRVVLGHALAPALVLSLLWTFLLVPSAILFPTEALQPAARACVGAGLALAGPPLLLLGVLVQSGVVLLLPGWATGEPGVVAMGQTLLRALAHAIVLPIVALPAVLTAALLAGAGHALGAGWAVAPVAGLAAAAVLGAECAVALLALGPLLDRLDPSDL